MSFKQWMKKVDAVLIATCGLSSHDLADCRYRDWYDDEMSPEEAARMALEYNGFPL